MTADNESPRVLLITRNFPPLTGGMERLMQQTAFSMCNYTKLTIVGPKGCASHCPTGVKVLEIPVSLGPFLFLSTWHAARACFKGKFNLLVGGSGIIAPTLLLLRILFGGKSFLFLHGLDLVVKNRIYQAFFVPCIRRADQVVANSLHTRQIAIKKGVPERIVMVINPGTNLPDLTNIQSRERFLKTRKIPFKKVMIFVGRITKRKGLFGFIQECLPIILASEPDAGLIVVGENPEQSLTKLGEARQVAAIISHLGLEEQIVFFKRLNDKELESLYAAADVQVFPLVDIPGDVEGFGMVAIEAAACGTPTVAFSIGGVVDAVSEKNGMLIEPGRYDLFADAVLRTLKDATPNQQQCVEHATGFSWDVYNEKIRCLVSSLK